MFMRVVVTTQSDQEVVGIWDGSEAVELYSGPERTEFPQEILVLDERSHAELLTSRNPSQLAESVIEFMKNYDPSAAIRSVVGEVLLWGELEPPEENFGQE